MPSIAVYLKGKTRDTDRKVVDCSIGVLSRRWDGDGLSISLETDEVDIR